jgi:two-component system, OmpR family, alkaline phosphatase synthesis response regulator PhoP
MEANTANKILIVDDEAHIRLLINQTLEELEDLGVELFSAEDGSQALEIIQSEIPQLVFLDVMMPKVDGLQVCQLVKQNPNLEQIYIVMLTAKGQVYDRQESLKAGANEYITKPFDPDEILKLAKKVFAI